MGCNLYTEGSGGGGIQKGSIRRKLGIFGGGGERGLLDMIEYTLLSNLAEELLCWRPHCFPFGPDCLVHCGNKPFYSEESHPFKSTGTTPLRIALPSSKAQMLMFT